MRLTAEVTADITLKPSAQIPILMGPRRVLRKRMVVVMVLLKALEKAIVKAVETATERVVQKAVRRVVQRGADPIAPTAEVPLVTAMPSPVVRLAETPMAILGLRQEIPEAS